MIDFYYVDPNFINYLKKYESEKRGFTRVPDIEYGETCQRKFVIGTVLQIGKYKYYAPVSHYIKQRPNNVLINVSSDKINPIKGSIRLNYMFPVLDNFLTKVEINQIQNLKHKRLLQKELKFCIDHEDDIYIVAQRTYLDVVFGSDDKLKKNSCDFKLLEAALDNPPPINKAEDTNKGLSLV